MYRSNKQKDWVLMQVIIFRHHGIIGYAFLSNYTHWIEISFTALKKTSHNTRDFAQEIFRLHVKANTSIFVTKHSTLVVTTRKVKVPLFESWMSDVC
jgi:hypothetical protein